MTPVREPVRNACKVCAPLGACLALRGIRGAIALLHGGQGCSTYIRRYLIGHFREPCDIPASNFDESAAIFGGGGRLSAAIGNVDRQFSPALIGVATTCLAETIGDDVPALVASAIAGLGDKAPATVCVSTPSYRGTHAEGFHQTVRELIARFVKPLAREAGLVAVLPGLLSPADLRDLRDLISLTGHTPILLPDYGDSCDGGVWQGYEPLPDGPTGLQELARLGGAERVLALGGVLDPAVDGSALLAQRSGAELHRQEFPIGIRATDALFQALGGIPSALRAERSRLLDALVDGHKHVSQKRVALWGEVDLVVALAGFCWEVGLQPAICASGAEGGRLRERLEALRPSGAEAPLVLAESDFMSLEAAVREHDCQLLLGHAKGYQMARRLKLPLVRIGFPVHDRLGGGRLRCVGYRGALELFDRITDALIGHEQDSSPVGYMNF
ncbi:MAG: nitrogenase component 1 [Leptolyngbya sp.]|nr:nitrogenase component 1 [Leptolyngbya sp.]